VRLHPQSWPIPPLFRLIQQRGGVPDEEMRRVFNLGVGMVVIIPAGQLLAAVAALNGQAWPIGEVIPGEQMVWGDGE
jgi:phosphoribosylformylglycinamidine cyclo-ligase